VSIAHGIFIETLQSLLGQLKGTAAPTSISWNTPTRQKVLDMLAYSPSGAAVQNTVQPGIQAHATIPDWAAGQPDTHARTTLVTATRSIAIELLMPRFRRVAQVTFVMAHEYSHVHELHTRGFSLTEAAPFINQVDEYVLLVWHSEFLAFSFQHKVTQEIITNSTRSSPPEPSYAADMKAEIPKDPIVSALDSGSIAHARRLIKDSYPHAAVAAEYQANRVDTSPPGLSIGAKVQAYRASTAWPDASLW
jgi:hypothetical protein